MTLPHRPRGRPKGSGINDRQRLRDIAALISSQPQIKPTTAIKMLGEHDPSVIRRLRDKFYSLQGELMEEVRSLRSAAAAGAFSQPSGVPGMASAAMTMPPLAVLRLDGSVRANVAAVGPEPLTRLADGSSEPRRLETASANPRTLAGPGAARETCSGADPTTAGSQTGPNAPANRAGAPTDLELEKAKLMELAAYNLMLGFAIQATVTAIGQQTKVYEETLRLPPVAALLKQQIAIGEMVMAMTWPGGQSRFEIPRTMQGSPA